jgi:hypothetical protein
MRRYRRIILYSQAILLWHVVLAALTAAVYLSADDFRHFAYWRRSAGTTVVLMAVPVILPYCISYAAARKIQTARTISVAVYLSVLTSGCGLVLAVLSGRFGNPGQGAIFVVLAVQAYVYYWAGRVALGQ